MTFLSWQHCCYFRPSTGRLEIDWMPLRFDHCWDVGLSQKTYVEGLRASCFENYWCFPFVLCYCPISAGVDHCPPLPWSCHSASGVRMWVLANIPYPWSSFGCCHWSFYSLRRSKSAWSFQSRCWCSLWCRRFGVGLGRRRCSTFPMFAGSCLMIFYLSFQLYSVRRY